MLNSNQYPTLAAMACLTDSIAGSEILRDIIAASAPFGVREVFPVEDLPTGDHGRSAAIWLLDCCTYVNDAHASRVHDACSGLLHATDWEGTSRASLVLLDAARHNRVAVTVDAICGGSK